MTSRENARHAARNSICSSVSRNSTLLRLRRRLTGRSMVTKTFPFSRGLPAAGVRVAALWSAAVMRRAILISLCLALAGCGGKASTTGSQPKLGAKGTDTQAAQGLGFPAIATKNTTRVGGADPVANAAGVAQAVFPAVDAASRPKAVTLVDSGDWRAGIAASALFARPVGAPILLSDGTSLPAASDSALKALQPSGSKAAGGAQVIRVGDVATVAGRKTTDIKGSNPFALGRAIDAFLAAAGGKSSDRVIVASADKPAFAMPAAAYAAKSGIPVLFVTRDSIP